ncbi:hypothetical protein HPB52_011719 [Rhipicephalus sanguineus]|uniref:Cullin family profile domain-containing protein n=1 Tax=Rhipicephalus sanguineus TaxID=34632 RepID=A0A9D4Q6F0_RHISA|nr:hypothetical protein HPB52_011719 [Rhipicephalus sanguineus]
MFKNMHISSSMTKQFKEAVSSCRVYSHGVDSATVRVLTTGFWPLAAAMQQSKIPVAPWSAYQIFQRLYLAKHNGRQIALQRRLGRLERRVLWSGRERTTYVPSGERIVRQSSAATSRHPGEDVLDVRADAVTPPRRDIEPRHSRNKTRSGI